MAPRGMRQAAQGSIEAKRGDQTQNVQEVFDAINNIFLGGTASQAFGIAEGGARADINILSSLGAQEARTRQDIFQQQIQRDPVLQRQQQAATGLLDVARSDIAEIQGGQDLPSDLRRTFTEEVRAAQSSRGVLEGPGSAIEEAVRLAGGREAFRSQRLAQAQGILSGGGFGTAQIFGPTELTSGAFGRLLPGGGQLSQLFGLGISGDLQRRIANAQNVVSALDSIGRNASNTVSGIV